MDGSALDAVLDGATLDEHGQRLRSLARALVGEPAADDLVQRTWLEALRSKTFAALGADDQGPYLRGIARRLAANERRQAARRTRREAAAARPEEVDGLGTDPRATTEQIELLEVVLKNLKTLPEPYRTTLRLRFLEQLSAREIGERTGASEGAVRVRVHRGLALMREQMDASHGGRRSQWVVPLSNFAGVDGVSSLTSAALPLARLAWMFGAVVLLSVPVLLFLRGDRTADRGSAPLALPAAPDVARMTAPTPTTASEAERSALGEPVATEAPTESAIASVRAVRMPSGEPLPGVLVQLREPDGTARKPFDYAHNTGTDGWAHFPDATPEVPRFELEVSAPGFATVVGNVAPDLALAGGLTVELWPLSSYSGQLLDEAGDPVADAVVELRSRWRRVDRARFVHGPERLRVRSDAEGRFNLEPIADGPLPPRLSVLHPEMVPREFVDLEKTSDLRAGLLSGNGEIVLRRAAGALDLQVVDGFGNPVEGATITPVRPVGRSASWSTVTDRDGAAHVAVGARGLSQVVITAAGVGPTNVLLVPPADGAPLRVVVGAAGRLAGRVSDRTGAAIPGATVEVVGLPLRLADGRILDGMASADAAHAAVDAAGDGADPTTVVSARARSGTDRLDDMEWMKLEPFATVSSDGSGRFEWPEAPTGPVLLTIRAPGFGALALLPAMCDEELEVVLDPVRSIAVHATSAADGTTPVDLRYTVRFGRALPDGSVLEVGRFGTAIAPVGPTAIAVRHTCDSVEISLHGRGFISSTTEWLSLESVLETELAIEVEPHAEGTLTILDPEGRPLGGAEAVAARPGAVARIEDGLLTPAANTTTLLSAADGRLEFERPPVDAVLVVTHPVGAAILDGDWHNHHELRLSAWSTVEVDGGPALAGCEVRLFGRRATRSDETVEGIGGYVPAGLVATGRATLDADGRAVLDRVLPVATRATVRRPGAAEPEFELRFSAEPGGHRLLTPPAGGR